jgi:uracil phosphoribosyltransferase
MKDNVFVMDHPLIQHKLTILRDERTGTKQFRELVSEIAMLMCYEATRDLPLKEVDTKTPVAIAKTKVIAGKKLAFVPILRAGLGMVDGVLALVPSARVGHIGLYRDEETLQPCEYYCKLPVGIEDKLVLVVDPMLATGGSACDAVTKLKEKGCKNIKFMAVIGAPEGVSKIAEAHPDIEIFVSTLDRCLNENGYILPGLGDAGDRLFGTK